MLFAEVVYEFKAFIAVFKTIFNVFLVPLYSFVFVGTSYVFIGAYRAEYGLLSALRVYRLDEERVFDGDAVCAIIGISLRPYRADSVLAVLLVSSLCAVCIFCVRIPSRRV